MKAIIFNSGLGKRMGEQTSSLHKSMLVLNDNESIFNRQLRILMECGINEFVVTLGPFREQLIEETKRTEFSELKFIFVDNEDYDKTNYIYSMYLARDFLCDGDFLLLHGDLVFNKELVEHILTFEGSTALINKTKELPKKDFKGRIKEGLLQEVGVDIFDSDCYALQPLYKLTNSDMAAWLKQVAEFVERKELNVYAENALNQILPQLRIKVISYDDFYIDEVDTYDDLIRIRQEISDFDYRTELLSKIS